MEREKRYRSLVTEAHMSVWTRARPEYYKTLSKNECVRAECWCERECVCMRAADGFAQTIVRSLQLSRRTESVVSRTECQSYPSLQQQSDK